MQTFTANVPIHAGDLIGIDPSNESDEIGVAEVAGASYGYIFPPPFEGATVAPSGSGPGKEIELSAEVQPTPTVTSVSPASGSIAGGTTVTISGHDFNSASAVKFGSTAAATYTVDSETQITATAPAGTVSGPVDVGVTTLAGSSAVVQADRFTYTACVVPKLAGKTLKLAKKSLKRADCELGNVSRRRAAKGKRGKVIAQSPKAGRALAPGTKVGVTLGK